MIGLTKKKERKVPGQGTWLLPGVVPQAAPREEGREGGDGLELPPGNRQMLALHFL